jgi:hypothetical protein
MVENSEVMYDNFQVVYKSILVEIMHRKRPLSCTIMNLLIPVGFSL